MWIPKRALVVAFAAVVGALSLALAGGAFGAPGNGHHDHSSHHGRRTGQPLIDESLAPARPNDPTFHGVAPGSLPWALKSGKVRLKRDGKFDLSVRGLIIPSLGNPGPVTKIDASLYCGPDSSTTPADTTQDVPISPRGDARIRDAHFNVPSTCLAPIILVHPMGRPMIYIALDGWRLS